MALTFPLPITSFADQIVINSSFFTLSDRRSYGMAESGEFVSRARGARRWQGTISLVAAPTANAIAVDTLLEALREPSASMLIYDHRRPYPLSDPTGAAIATAPVVIASVSVNHKEMTLSGMPAGYVLTRGDYLSFSYLDPIGQTQYSLHRVVDLTVAANGFGLTPQFEVQPFLPQGVTLAGLSVNLRKPVCKAVLSPDGFEGSRGEPGLISRGQTFQFIQTRR